MQEKTYIAIDLKSFYASCACVERGVDPLTTHLVVADASRTEKTICLAVTPSLKACGLPGRARLFEVTERVREINAERLRRAPGRRFTGSSVSAPALAADPALKLDFLIAPPRMQRYMEISNGIYAVYLKYVAPEDIHVYSIDEVFIDATKYLKLFGQTAREFAMTLIRDVLSATGITATAGIGPNLYLCKVAMDIMAKRIPADKDGVRIAELDEQSYRRELWCHRPLTDFWRVGRGYAARLQENGMFTMGDVARCSVKNEDLLYRLFGVNAELLIDHAWGWEPCTIAQIKAYEPENRSLSEGQVLPCPYPAEKAKLVVREMTDRMALELVSKRLAADRVTLTLGYAVENLKDEAIRAQYAGEIAPDWYGRAVPKQAHGSENLGGCTSSEKIIMDAVTRLFDRIANPRLLIRRMYLVADHVTRESDAANAARFEQMDLFTDHAAKRQKEEAENARLERERQKQEAILDIKQKFGRNAILKGMDLENGATARERNETVGGHRK